MRMWMVDPRVMCRRHLLGEHVELHMFVGHINKGRSITGYIENNCIQPRDIHSRHRDVVKEMKHRGFNHQSPLPQYSLVGTLVRFIDTIVDSNKSLKDLISRCPYCLRRYNESLHTR